LKEIAIPKSAVFLGPRCFSECKSLESVCFEDGSEVNAICESAFSWSGLKTIQAIPSSVSILSKAVLMHTFLRSVDFSAEENIHEIQECAFSESELISISIPSSVTVVGKASFSLCKPLERVEFAYGSTLKCIEECAFFGSGLKSIEIPSSVVDLGKSAFSSCRRLETVAFKSDSPLKTIEQSAFSWSGLKVFEIPSLVTSNDGSAFVGVSLKSVSVSAGNPAFRVYGSFLEDSFGSAIYRYFGAERSVVVPFSVRILGKSSFSACKSVRSIRSESGSQLERVEESTFSESGLKSIIIPPTVAFIDISAFVGISLRSVWVARDNRVFRRRKCFLESLEDSTIYRHLGTSHSIVIPPSVLVLGRSSSRHASVSNLLDLPWDLSLSGLGNQPFVRLV
jgi:hypothetical protein